MAGQSKDALTFIQVGIAANSVIAKIAAALAANDADPTPDKHSAEPVSAPPAPSVRGATARAARS